MKEQATDILIEGLRMACRIGVPIEERSTSQIIVIDVIYRLGDHAIHQDRMEESVDYAVLAAEIQDIAQKKTFALLETFAQEIARLGFNHSRIISVEVTVRKKQKLPSCESVGVRRVFVRDKKKR